MGSLVKIYHFDDLEIAKVADEVTASLRVEGDGNACLLIVTNNIDDVSKIEQIENAKSVIINKNPNTSATAIFNQAIQFNDVENMLNLCSHLRAIANVAEANIRDEVNRLKTNN